MTVAVMPWVGEGLEALAAAGDQDKVWAAGSQLMSELDTDPGAGSGEEGGLLTIVDGGHGVFPVKWRDDDTLRLSDTKCQMGE